MHCLPYHPLSNRASSQAPPIWRDQVLLCKRAIAPATATDLPAGFLENSETIAEGAARETMEEANARVRRSATVYSLQPAAHFSGLYVFSRRSGRPEYSSGPESLEVELFYEQDIPWDQLAFPVITQTLQHYFADRKPTSIRPITKTYYSSAQSPDDRWRSQGFRKRALSKRRIHGPYSPPSPTLRPHFDSYGTPARMRHHQQHPTIGAGKTRQTLAGTIRIMRIALGWFDAAHPRNSGLSDPV